MCCERLPQKSYLLGDTDGNAKAEQIPIIPLQMKPLKSGMRNNPAKVNK